MAWVSDRYDIIDRQTPSAVPELWSVFAPKPNGTVPSEFDTQHAATVVTAGSVTSTSIDDGLFTMVPGSSGSAAAYYYNPDELNGTAIRIGARFVFLPGGTRSTGSMCLGICNAAPTDPEEGAPDMAVHFVLAPETWSFGPWAGPNNGNTGWDIILTENFSTPCTNDGVTEYEAEIFLTGNTATIDISGPEGPTRYTVTDNRLNNSSYGGPYVFFECYNYVAASDTTAALTHVWASSIGNGQPGNTPEFQPWAKAVAGTEATTTTPGSYTPTDINGLSTILSVAPPSGTVVRRIGAFLEVPTAGAVYLAADFGGGVFAA